MVEWLADRVTFQRKSRRRKRSCLPLLVAASVLLFWGCAPQSPAPKARLDSQSRAVEPVDEAATQQAIQRVSWETPSWKPHAQERKWTYVVIHHTATDAGSVESIHRSHLKRRDAAGKPWRGIGYHFVIGNGRGMEDGVVEPTFRWREQLAGAHAGIGEYNQRGIGICLVGNFEKYQPTRAQVAALKGLVTQLSGQYAIPAKHIVRHGEIKKTSCPGRHLSTEKLLPGSPSSALANPEATRTGR